MSMQQLKKIRNIGIIAHIDAGKTTVTEAILYLTGLKHKIGVVHEGDTSTDWMEQERERGVTIVSAAITSFWKQHRINLIDTPGHVDFSYEVSRSLHACQGALLLVDAAKGVQAQTMANFYLAFEKDLKIIPVINKIDLPNARPEHVAEELKKLFDFSDNEILFVSAKSGEGVKELLDAIIREIPAPPAHPDKPLKALLFDSWFDEYRGVICLIEIVDGHFGKKGDKIITKSDGDLLLVSLYDFNLIGKGKKD